MLNPIFSIGHLREMSEYLRFSIASLLRPSALQYRYSIMSLVKFASFKVIQFAADTLICLTNSYRVPLQAESKTDPKRYAILLLISYTSLRSQRASSHTDWNIILDDTNCFGTDWPKWLWLFIRWLHRRFHSVCLCCIHQTIHVSSNKRSLLTMLM